MRIWVAAVSGIVAVSLAACGPTKEEIAIKAAREQVKINLVDPESAQFQFEQVGDQAVCGVVNAKNRMGGYNGPQSFVVPMSISDTAAIPNGEVVVAGMNANSDEFIVAQAKCPGAFGDVARKVLAEKAASAKK